MRKNMNKLNKIIVEEIQHITEYVNNEVVSLIQYFSQTDEEKKKYLPYSLPWLFEKFLADTDSDYSIDDKDDFDIGDIPKDLQEEYGEWLFYNVTNGQLDIEAVDYPAWSYFDKPILIKNQWLIHFTDNANDIAREGFKFGVSEQDKLGLTTHLGEFDKKYGGYNFAYMLSDFMRYGVPDYNRGTEFKYGSNAVIFRASGIKLWHSSDNEPQVIFWGETAANIIPIIESDDAKWAIFSNKTNRVLYASDNLEIVVKWLVQNFEQYRKQLY